MRDPRDRRFAAVLGVAALASVGVAAAAVTAVTPVHRWEFVAAGVLLVASPACWRLVYVRLDRPGALPIRLSEGGHRLLRIGTTLAAITAVYLVPSDARPGWLLYVGPPAAAAILGWLVDRADWIEVPE